MALADSLVIEADAIHKGTRCTVCVMVEDMPEDDRAALLAAFEDSRVTSSAICRALKREGYSCKEQAVRRHRRGICLGAA